MRRPGSSFNDFFRRGYSYIFAFVFIFHIAFSALPAMLMAKGWSGPADLIYKYYRVMCHQYPWRSWFLYGPQAHYPLGQPGESSLVSFQDASGTDPDRINPHDFYGTPEMGYKMAICQRDVAIYAAMALFCVIFAAAGCRIRKPKWPLPLLIGCLPIAVDGITQLLGRAFPGVFPARESDPLLRTVTGALFGFCLCWFLIPRLEESLRKGEME